MCGIFGLIQKPQIDVRKLRKVSSVIAHRGPDDEGYLLADIQNNTYQAAFSHDSVKGLNLPELDSVQGNFNAALVHRRLSIIDLSVAGHQPMSYDDGLLWIAFNGEIYNYVEIKKDLIKKGYRFFTSSDTEVILAAYKEWGFDCCRIFNGIWAFAIYDREKKLFFLSRDRVGVKPLYYYFSGGSFIFGSEIKSISCYLNKQIRVNKMKLEEYLSVGQNFSGYDDSTYFEEIRQLRPATNLIFSENKIQLQVYWQLNTFRNNNSFDKNINKFAELFGESIKMQFRSDVEVGSCLSGGLDSSSIVSYASSVFERKLHTFSAIWPNDPIDESFYIGKVNELHSCLSHTFEPDMKDIFGLIDKIIWHQETPLSGASLIAQWKVFEYVKKCGVKVVLDGEGSDEVLSGYPRYVLTYLNEIIRQLKWIEILKYNQSLSEAGYSIKSMIRFQIDKVISDKNSYEFSKFPYKYSTLYEYMKDEVEKYSLPALLHNKDRNSMAHSVEARVPFLDHNIIEFAASIPAEQKIHGTLTKVILRESMKSVLPMEIYNRTDKIGFGTPIEKRIFSEGSESYSEIKNFIDHSELMKNIIEKKYNFDKVFNYRKFFCLYTAAKFVQKWS